MGEEYDINYLNNLNDPFVFRNDKPDLSGTGNVQPRVGLEPLYPNFGAPMPMGWEKEQGTGNVPLQADTGNVVPNLQAPDWTSVYGDPNRIQGFEERGQPLGGGIAPIYNNALAANNNNLPFNPIKSAKNFIQNKILNKANFTGMIPLGAQLLGAVLPKEDPRTTEIRNYYSGMYGTDDIGRISEGDLMAGYNPISGGGLYTLTGGRAGDPPTQGLDRAYQKRIEGIEKTLRRKYKMTDTEIADIYAGDYKGDVSSDLINRIVTLKDRQTKDKKTINRIKQKHGANENTIRNPNVSSKVNYGKKDTHRESYRGNITPSKKSNVHSQASYDRRT
jgi:hypothetical protein